MADQGSTKVEIVQHDAGTNPTEQFNYLVRNTGGHPLTAFSFMLRVEGIYDLPCKAVRGFDKKNEFEYVQEGGLNDFVHMLRKPISQPFEFKVERYVGVDWIDPLPLGCEPILPIILFVTNGNFSEFKAVKTYTFTGCVVTAKSYGDLDAEKSGLVVETTTIAYRQMVCVTIPTETFEEKTDAFKVLAEQKSKYLGHHADGGLKSKTKAEMQVEAEKNKWQLDKSAPKKTKKAQVLVDKDGKPITEMNKAQMQAEAEKNKWQLDKSAPKKTKKAQVLVDKNGKPIEPNKAAMIQEAEKNKWQLDKDKPKKTLNAKRDESEPNEKTLNTRADKNKWELHRSNPKKTNRAVTIEGELNKRKMKSKGTEWELMEGSPKKTNRAVTNDGELAKSEMIGKGTEWELAKGSPKKTNRAVVNEGELNEAAMSSMARKWPAKKSAQTMAQLLSGDVKNANN